ncbi:hypothetical protein ACFQYP_24940 [Nonomuraea antimicrobica]
MARQRRGGREPAGLCGAVRAVSGRAPGGRGDRRRGRAAARPRRRRVPLADTFYGGGRWPLLAGFLGWNHARAGRRAEAQRYLDWMAAQATPAGDLPEQVSDLLLFPERRREWLDRWGTVATPLLWSHGMYLVLAGELGVGA